MGQGQGNTGRLMDASETSHADDGPSLWQEWAALEHARESCSLLLLDEELCILIPWLYHGGVRIMAGSHGSVYWQDLYAVGGYTRDVSGSQPVPTEVYHVQSTKVVRKWEAAPGWGSFGACVGLVGQ